MLGNGYEPGMGLGKDNGGRTSLISSRGNRGKFGLGYCRNLPFGGRATRDLWVRVPRKEYMRSHHQRLFEENVEKTGEDVIYEL